MSALPQAVREAAARADAMQKKIKAGQPLTAEDLGPSLTGPTNPEPPKTPVLAPAPTPVIAAVPPPVTAAPPPVVPPAVAPVSTPEVDWKHKFDVLQGKYNAEVPRLHEQNRNSAAQLQQMGTQLASLQSLVGTLGQQQQAAPPVPARLVEDKEIKEFGSDLYDFIQRVSEQTVLPKIGAMVEQRVAPVAQQVQQLGPQVGAVQQQQAQSAQDRVYMELDRIVPDWESLNNTPEFTAWLSQRAPYTRASRGAILAQAFQNGDAPQVAEFFEGYRKENAVVSPPAPTPPAAPASATPAVSLVALAAPGTGNGGPATGAPNEAGGRIYTVADISAFYRDVQRGAFRGRVADAQAIEKDIFLAQKQGRVRPR